MEGLHEEFLELCGCLDLGRSEPRKNRKKLPRRILPAVLNAGAALREFEANLVGQMLVGAAAIFQVVCCPFRRIRNTPKPSWPKSVLLKIAA